MGQIDLPIVDCIDRNSGFVLLKIDFKIEEVSDLQNRWGGRKLREALDNRFRQGDMRLC